MFVTVLLNLDPYILRIMWSTSRDWKIGW